MTNLLVSQTVSYGYDSGSQQVKVTDSGGTRSSLYIGRIRAVLRSIDEESRL